MRNLLLAALPPSDKDILLPGLEKTELARGLVIELPGRPVEQAFFIASGFVSILIDIGPRRMEVGLVGPEGMLGLPSVLGSEVAAYRAVVRETVQAYRIPVERLRTLMGDRRALGAVLLRYMQAGVVQITHTAFANAHLTIAQRLARWILMAHDRVNGDTLRVTHAVISDALGVQRSGVTLALHELEGEGAVRSLHRALTILDRAALKARTLGAYGPAERAYRMLLGHHFARD